MTTEELLTAFSTAGFDTPQKVTALLSMASKQMTRNAKLIAIDNCNAEQAAAISAINAKRATLQGEANALTDQIIAAVAPAQ